MTRVRNTKFYDLSREESDRLMDEYRSLGFHVGRDGNVLTIFSLPPRKVKKKDDDDRKRRDV